MAIAVASSGPATNATTTRLVNDPRDMNASSLISAGRALNEFELGVPADMKI